LSSSASTYICLATSLSSRDLSRLRRKNTIVPCCFFPSVVLGQHAYLELCAGAVSVQRVQAIFSGPREGNVTVGRSLVPQAGNDFNQNAEGGRRQGEQSEQSEQSKLGSCRQGRLCIATAAAVCVHRHLLGIRPGLGRGFTLCSTARAG